MTPNASRVDKTSIIELPLLNQKLWRTLCPRWRGLLVAEVKLNENFHFWNYLVQFTSSGGSRFLGKRRGRGGAEEGGHFTLTLSVLGHMAAIVIVLRPFSGNFTRSETHAVKNSEEVLSYFFHLHSINN
jgi:hypothetical protein